MQEGAIECNGRGRGGGRKLEGEARIVRSRRCLLYFYFFLNPLLLLFFLFLSFSLSLLPFQLLPTPVVKYINRIPRSKEVSLNNSLDLVLSCPVLWLIAEATCNRLRRLT